MSRKRNPKHDAHLRRPTLAPLGAGIQTPEELQARGYRPGVWGPDFTGAWSAEAALRGLKAAAEWRRQVGSGWKALPSNEKEKYLSRVLSLFSGRPALVGAGEVLLGDIVGEVQDSRTLMMELSIKAGLLASSLLKPVVELIEAGKVTWSSWEQFIEGLADVIEVLVKENEPKPKPAPDGMAGRSLDDVLDEIHNPPAQERYAKALYEREILKLIILNMVFKEMIKREWEAGKKVIGGGREGHKIKYGTQEQKDARWREYQEFIDRQHRSHPTWSYAALTKDAAIRFKVAQKTIRRHSHNPLNVSECRLSNRGIF